MKVFFLLRYWIIYLIVFTISACSKFPESEVTSVPDTSVISPTKTISPTQTSSQVVEVTLTNTPMKSQMPTFTPESRLLAIQIEPGSLFAQKTNSCIYYNIRDVSWFENNTQIQYSYEFGDLCTGDNKSSWAVYNILSHSSITTTQPTNILMPIDTPDIQGFRSPSGEYLLFATQTKNQESYGTSTLWLENGQGVYKIKDFVYPVYITNSIWYEDESKVIFSVSFEGGANLFIVDTQTKMTNSINEISGFDKSEEMWSLSPDGKKLAIVEYGSSLLWIVSLENGNTTNTGLEVAFPLWSIDSNILYYWSGSMNDYDFIQGNDLYKYDFVSGDISILVTISSLKESLGFIPLSAFTVSPDQNKLVVWNGDELWLVILNNNR